MQRQLEQGNQSRKSLARVSGLATDIQARKPLMQMFVTQSFLCHKRF